MNPVYLDHAATTPVRTEVRAAMAPFLEGRFGNPSSPHRWGREAAAALAEARALCAEALGARFGEIYFVRGGTESDNLAVAGRAARVRDDGGRPTVAVSAVEHKAVLDAARAATSTGCGRLVVVPVSAQGELDEEALDDALGDGPSALASLMWVNNETGMVLPVPEAAERTRRFGAILHSDAVQAVGRIPVNVGDVPVDLLTATGHKIGGPKGTGLLFVREGVALHPLLHGGGQERGLRPGTEDVAGAVGLARALHLAAEEQPREAARLGALREELERRLAASVPGLRVNGGSAPRAPHVSSVAVPGVDGPSLLMSLDLEGIAASGGAACGTGGRTASHVMAALYGADDDHATVRFSLGAGTTEEEVERAAAATAAVVERLHRRRAGA
jgi:cysteine desulfurase